MESDPGELGHCLLNTAFRCRRTASAPTNSALRKSKTIQEIITLSIFPVFSVFYLGEKFQ